MAYTITIREATTLTDAEMMRKVRNTCRLFMTRDNSEKSFEQQKLWFRDIDRTELVPFLAETKETISSVVGYGIVLFRNDRYWLTGGLLPDYRSKGLGEQLFRLLIDHTSLPVWLEVLEDNVAAMKLYLKLGFRSMGVTTNSENTKRIISMVLSPEFVPVD